jgi:hypothetical protein
MIGCSFRQTLTILGVFAEMIGLLHGFLLLLKVGGQADITNKI